MDPDKGGTLTYTIITPFCQFRTQPLSYAFLEVFTEVRVKGLNLLQCLFCSCENENEYHVLHEYSDLSYLRCMLSSSLNITPVNVPLIESTNHECIARYLL